MAGSVSQGAPDLKQVWTFLISSGPQIKVGLPDNPVLDYPGHGQIVWKVILTREMATSYLRGLMELGVKVTCYTEDMTEEMGEEKAKIQGGCDSQ